MKKKDIAYPAWDGRSPWKLESAETVELLESHSDEGLDSSQARSRLQKYGQNRIEAAKQRSIRQILTAQTKNLISGMGCGDFKHSASGFCGLFSAIVTGIDNGCAHTLPVAVYSWHKPCSTGSCPDYKRSGTAQKF